MEMVRAIELITAAEQEHRHGDHISFNTAEFIAWSQRSGESLEPMAADRLLAEFCKPIGHGDSGIMWRYFPW